MTTAREILEEAGLAEAHWGQRIITAEEAGGFTEGDVEESAGWTTCACGKLDDGIPRDRYGEPRDRILTDLGVNFFGLIEANEVVSAAEILVAIEKRAIQVLMGIAKGES